MPLALKAESGNGVTLETPETFQWMPSMNGIGEKEEMELFRLLNAPATNEPGTIDFLRHTAMNAVISSERVREAVGKYKGRIEYPNNRLGYGLKLIAQMIAGNLSTKVYYANMTGFDTHAAQRGAHEALLRELAEGEEAFYRHLEALGGADRHPATTFRSVYAAVRDKWPGPDPAKILGAPFERVPFI